MEEGKISESSPIMGENATSMNENNSSAKKPFVFTRMIKILVIISTIGVAFLVLYYASFNHFGQLLLPPLHGHDSSSSSSDELVTNELKKVLKAASTKEKTVILTTLNEAWASPNSIFDLFLESFRNGNETAWLLNHLVVIALDDKAYIQCRKLVSHCYFLKTRKSTKLAHEATFMTPIYLDMMWERLAFLQSVLSLGFNFIFTDTDVMWFRNPFPHFTLDSDFQTSCDQFNGREFDTENFPNNGFVFVRSNKRTIQFYKFWVGSRHTYPHLHDQDVLNRIKNSAFIRQLGMKLRFLDTNYFGGFCNPSKDFDKVYTMHANCCVGLDRKLADLRTTIEAWKTYFSSDHSTSQSWHWGVPKQCHM